MITLLLLPLLAFSPYLRQETRNPDGDSLAVVLSFKWSKSRQVVEKLNDPPGAAPTAAMTSANKNFERNRRINDPAGVRDPNADTIDGRSAALERSVQEARAAEAKPVDGFAYRVKVRNAGQKPLEIIFWEYRFTETANPANVIRRQFLCVVNIKPDKDKELEAFSVSGPSRVVSAESLARQTGNPFEEKVIINRVEYKDGSIWQRKDWNFAEIKPGLERAVGTPWGAEMCRGL